MRRLFKMVGFMLLLVATYQRSFPQRFPVFANLSVGPSFAVGDFASKNSNSGGFAKTGFNVLLNGGVLFNSNFGFGIMANATFSKMSDSNWGDNPKYLYNALLVGPVFSVPASQRVRIDMRMMGGYSQLQINDGFAMDVSGCGFSYDAGASLRYFIGAHWTVNASLDYFDAKIKYRYDYGEQRVQALNITFGAGFNF